MCCEYHQTTSPEVVRRHCLPEIVSGHCPPRQIAIYRVVSNGIVGAAIGRPPTNCNAICWFSAGKQLVIALRRCDFVEQNHADERCSPLRCVTKLPDKQELAGASICLRLDIFASQNRYMALPFDMPPLAARWMGTACPINGSLNIQTRERTGRSKMCNEYYPTTRLEIVSRHCPLDHRWVSISLRYCKGVLPVTCLNL